MVLLGVTSGGDVDWCWAIEGEREMYLIFYFSFNYKTV